MDQQFRTQETERLTPLEAEEVIKRFRYEEELRQKEMEAQATNPTVADLAEGLGVAPDRVAALLAQVRGDAVPPARFRAEPLSATQDQDLFKQRHKSLIIVAALVGSLLLLAMFAALFVYTTVETPAPTPPVEVSASVIEGAPTTDTVAPSPTE